MPRDVLICGAGVAGTALAYWLARHGMRPTVVERSAGLRSSGAPVDVRREAEDVIAAMGLTDQVRAAATRSRGVRLLDAQGGTIGTVSNGALGGGTELMRSDLVRVLHGAAHDDAEILFDETVTALHQDDDGVDVTFDHAAPRRFDLAVGADGLHSTVRRQAFGPEHAFVRPYGLHVATAPMPDLFDDAEDPAFVQLYNTPGHLTALHPSRDVGGAAFIFRAPPADLRGRDADGQKAFVRDAYAGVGWRVPELLDRLDQVDDLYLDAVSTVDLPSWTAGRITLLGDAASCVSLLGEGSSLALAGARTLADALAASPSDVAPALAAYERAHRARVMPRRRGVRLAASVLVPRTRAGLGVRNAAARLMPRTR